MKRGARKEMPGSLWGQVLQGSGAGTTAPLATHTRLRVDIHIYTYLQIPPHVHQHTEEYIHGTCALTHSIFIHPYQNTTHTHTHSHLRICIYEDAIPLDSPPPPKKRRTEWKNVCHLCMNTGSQTPVPTESRANAPLGVFTSIHTEILTHST